MMNQEIKTKWINALRSGDYEQGQGALKNPDGQYCCLGVLCDLYDKHRMEEFGAKSSWTVDTVSLNEYISVLGDRSEVGVPPNAVVDWAGLSDNNPDILIDFEDEVGDSRPPCSWTFAIAELNDDKGFTFNELADLIEKQL
jgi:hypothetical protein